MTAEHDQLTHADISREAESSAPRGASRGPCHRLPRCCARSPWALLSSQHHDDWQEEGTPFPASVRNPMSQDPVPKASPGFKSHFKMSAGKANGWCGWSLEAPRSGGTQGGLIRTSPYSSSVAVSSPEEPSGNTHLCLLRGSGPEMEPQEETAGLSREDPRAQQVEPTHGTDGN